MILSGNAKLKMQKVAADFASLAFKKIFRER
jgi:hypothetical protein